jgi:serine/threonine-protein kinase
MQEVTSMGEDGDGADAAELLRLGLADGHPQDAETPPEIPGLGPLTAIGSGGMGTVYRAMQRSLGREVAVKLVRPALVEDPLFAARFRREARLLASLEHPGIVAVHEYGKVGDRPYLVMELVRGRPLRKLIAEGLQPRDALRITEELCDALEYAHTRGVVHRDIKPDNVIIDEDGRPRLADFGLSRMAGDDNTSITEASVMGTPLYIAPERAVGGVDGDHRVDLYALGVLLYEMLTGAPPLGNYRPVSRRVPVDASADAVIDRALQPEPEARFTSAAELREAVHAVKVLAELPSADGERRPTFAYSRGDKFIKTLTLVAAAPLFIAVMLGYPLWVLGTGFAVILAIHVLRQAYIFVRSPDGPVGTRAAFRLLMILALIAADVAVLPHGLCAAVGADWYALDAGTQQAIRLLAWLLSAGCIAGVVFVVRTRGVRAWPLIRGHVEPARPRSG